MTILGRKPRAGRRVLSVAWDSVSLVIGFGLTIAGVIGSQIYLTPVSDQKLALSRHLDSTWAQLKIIRAAQALLGLSESCGGLVYLVHPDFDRDYSSASAIAEVTNRAIHGRHDATRNYFAQVAAANEGDFADLNRRYDALVAVERTNWTLETYSAANRFPAELSMKVARDRWPLEQSVWRSEKSLRAAIFEQSRRAGVLALINALGAAIIFAAALAAARATTQPAEKSATQAAAVSLMEAALAEARRRLGEARQPCRESSGSCA
jgi:hypothetical protein